MLLMYPAKEASPPLRRQSRENWRSQGSAPPFTAGTINVRPYMGGEPAKALFQV